jgi:hypothetical protein
MTDLFTIPEFASYLQQDVDTSSATVARRVANGWLLSATGLSDWTVPVADMLFGWGLELAAIAFRNPDGVSSEGVDDHNVTWDRLRRAEILKAAANSPFGSAGTPVYSFPDADWHWNVVPTVNPLTA